MSTTAPDLPADLVAGLRRLKLASMRRLAPELLVTAKTQRWSPEDFLRTLVEAEIASRGRVQRRGPTESSEVPGPKNARGVRRGCLVH